MTKAVTDRPNLLYREGFFTISVQFPLCGAIFSQSVLLYIQQTRKHEPGDLFLHLPH